MTYETKVVVADSSDLATARFTDASEQWKAKPKPKPRKKREPKTK